MIRNVLKNNLNEIEEKEEPVKKLSLTELFLKIKSSKLKASSPKRKQNFSSVLEPHIPTLNISKVPS